MKLFKNKLAEKEAAELYKDVSYLVDALEGEWAKSKEGKKQVLVSKATLSAYTEDMKEMTDASSRMLNSEHSDLSFRDSMELVKQNYIMLRIAKKLVAASKASNRAERFEVLFDKEEYRYFVECYPEYK